MNFLGPEASGSSGRSGRVDRSIVMRIDLANDEILGLEVCGKMMGGCCRMLILLPIVPCPILNVYHILSFSTILFIFCIIIC